MKKFKLCSLMTAILLAVCLIGIFMVSAAEVPTVSFDELKGRDEGVLSSDGFSAALSSRESVKGGKNTSDLRIVIVANYELLNANRDATLTVALGGKSFTYSIVQELEVFQTVKAAGIDFVAEEGSVLTGLILTEVPDWAWSDITVTLSATDVNYEGSLGLDKVITHKTVGAFGTTLLLENHHSNINYEPAAVFNHSTVVDMLNNRGYTLKIRYNGKLYTPTRFYNSGSYVRASLSSAGIAIDNGKSYTFNVVLYDENDNLCWYTDDLTATANMQYAHVGLPEGLEKAEESGLPRLEGQSGSWDGGADKIMDGDAETRWLINAGDDQTVTLYFTTEKPEVLTYYTYYTHNEASRHANRQSAGWVLYGRLSTQDEWVKLDEVESYLHNIKIAGLGLSYSIDNPTACQQYKMEFTVPNKNQNNYQLVIADIELYTASSAEKAFYGAAVDTSKMKTNGISAWGDSPVGNLFDGNTTSTKLGGKVSGGKLTVEFSLTKSVSLAYYTLYTGGDTSMYSSRNPNSWTLYGKVDDTWVVLDTVTETGLLAVNSTPFGYAIDGEAPECIDYKIEFVTNSDFQMNELQLFAGSAVTVTDYVVVYDDTDEALGDQVESFVTRLNQTYGVTVSSTGISAVTEPYAKEILIGDVSAQRSAVGAVVANCTVSDFAISVEDDDIILYATDDTNYEYMFSVFFSKEVLKSVDGELTCVATDDYYYHTSDLKQTNYLQYQYQTISNFNTAALTAHFTYHSTTKSNGATLAYRLYVPSNYDPDKEYPLVVVLHGAGERGVDNEKQFGNLIFDLFNHTNSPMQDAIVLAPQCPTNNQWVDTPWADGNYDLTLVPESDELQAVMKVLGELQTSYSVDSDRIYAMGLSMGGFGTWNLLMNHGDVFAAGIPICGGADPNKAADLAKIPIRTFHCAGDPTVPCAGTREMAEAIQANDPVDFTYTEFSDNAHDCWTRVGKDISNLEWLFAQSKAN